ncbi:MAG TPA: hypothetical protein PLF22_10775 [Pseudomonadales bacterium]|nr:hypothetical protein [Pseudomonadales bacterium]
MRKGWIGVDLDGTLVQYDERRGTEVIGDVAEPMFRRVRAWMAEGVDVRLFTARATDSMLVSFLKPWLREHNLQDMPVTNRKDTGLMQLWDDRAVCVEKNTAQILTPKQFVPLVPSGWLGIELDGVLARANSPQSLGQIGEPIPLMVNRVRQWQMVGIDVRLFSRRAGEPGQLPLIENWLAMHGLQLPVTCEKDFQMSAFYDAAAVHVAHNSGEPSMPAVSPALQYQE